MDIHQSEPASSPSASRRYAHPFDPFDLAICFSIERTRQFLAMSQQAHRPTQVIFESRGKRHDRAAQIELQQILPQANPLGQHQPRFSRFPIESSFISQQLNLAGHQICDLLALPLAKWSFDRSSHQQTMQITQRQLIAHKVFPRTEWQRPTRSRPSP